MQFHGISHSASDAWSDGPRVGSSGKLHCFYPGSTSKEHTFKSLEKAQDRCNNDSSCNFIWSRNCDGQWASCEVGVPVEPVGDESSCTKVKPANQFPTEQRRMEVQPGRNFGRGSKQEPGADFLDWRLCNTTVHSNLGMLGPDSGESEIRFVKVATVSDGIDVDLVITNTSEYSSNSVYDNGLKDCFGSVNFPAPSSVTLSFRFVRSGTNEMVELGRFFFTVYEMGEFEESKQARVSFNTAVNAYWLVPGSDMVNSMDGGLSFTSTVMGRGSPHPSDPTVLTSMQQARAVTVNYVDVGEFSITLDTVEGDTGRTLLFAGKSDLTIDGEETNFEGTSCEVWADYRFSGFDQVPKGPVSFIGGRLSTFDQQPVDVTGYEIGEFWLVKSADVRIQARYSLSREFAGGRAAVAALAVGGPFLGGSRLVVEPKSGTVEWNGNQLDESSKFVLGDPSILVLLETYYNASHDRGTAPSGVDVSLPRGISLKVRRYNTHLDLKITATRGLGAVDGQCGNFNGNAQDDSSEEIKARMFSLTVAPRDSLFSS